MSSSGSEVPRMKSAQNQGYANLSDRALVTFRDLDPDMRGMFFQLADGTVLFDGRGNAETEERDAD